MAEEREFPLNRAAFFFGAAIFLFLMTIPVFAGGKSDDWADSVKKNYPDSEYISAVGSGKDRASAESDAKLALSQILGESISAEQVTMQYADSTGREEGMISSVVNEKAVFEHITGIVIKENYVDKKTKTYYALAVLNRKESGDYYFAKANEASLHINDLVSKAKKLRGKVDSLSYLNEAIDISEDTEYNVNLLSVISPAQGRIVRAAYQSPQSLRTVRAELASAVTVSVAVQGDSDGRIRSAFVSALRDKGVTVVDSGGTYIIDADISFEHADVADPQHIFVRYILNAPMTEIVSGNTVVPYTLAGREGHVTESQAKNRAVIKMSGTIKTEYLR